MKITAEALTNALRPAADILRGKPAQDAPRYLKLEASKKRLVLSANYDNQSSRTEVECDGDLKPFCVQFNNLQNIMSLFGENVTMDYAGKNLQIKSGGTYSLSTMPANVFVDAQWDKLDKIAVNCADLADCINAVKFASRVEDSRPQLFGVTVRLSPTKVSAESSTGLIFAFMSKASIAVDCEFLIPQPFVQNILNSLRNPGAVLSVSKTKISVEFDGGCYMCSFLECEPIKPMLKHFEQRKSIGEATPSEWMQVFRTINGMAGANEKMAPKVTIDAGRIKYDGEQGSVDTKIDKLSKPLRLNASTFMACLEAFPQGKCKASLTTDTAFVLEQGDLFVATTQLR